MDDVKKIEIFKKYIDKEVFRPNKNLPSKCCSEYKHSEMLNIQNILLFC